MLIFIVSFLVTAAAAIIQSTNWLLLTALLKPNLILVILLILATINQNWIARLLLVLTAALILKFSPGLAYLDFIFMGSVLSAIALMDLLPWRQTITLLLATGFGTIIINLSHLTFLPLIYELALNEFLAFALFTLLKLIYVPQVKLQRNRF